MKIVFRLPVLMLSLFVLISCNSEIKIDRDIIYQTGPFEDLLEGKYDGFVFYSELDKYGDFGIGTIDGLDGEGIEFEGEKFTISWEGKAIKVPENITTPFAMKTFFEVDKKQSVAKEFSYPELHKFLDNLISDKNKICAIKISGIFKYMKTRSMEKQHKPYLPLLAAIKEQKIFEFENVTGIMAGFYIPEKFNNLNPAGYHFHFLADNKNTGGHILDLITKDIIVEIDESKTIELINLQ